MVLIKVRANCGETIFFSKVKVSIFSDFGRETQKSRDKLPVSSLACRPPGGDRKSGYRPPRRRVGRNRNHLWSTKTLETPQTTMRDLRSVQDSTFAESRFLRSGHRFYRIWRKGNLSLCLQQGSFRWKTKRFMSSRTTDPVQSVPFTHYRPAMPFGNRKIHLRGSFLFSIVTI